MSFIVNLDGWCCGFVDLWLMAMPAYPVLFSNEAGELLVGRNLQETLGLESGRGYFDTQISRRARRAIVAGVVCIKSLSVERCDSCIPGREYPQTYL